MAFAAGVAAGGSILHQVGSNNTTEYAEKNLIILANHISKLRRPFSHCPANPPPSLQRIRVQSQPDAGFAVVSIIIIAPSDTATIPAAVRCKSNPLDTYRCQKMFEKNCVWLRLVRLLHCDHHVANLALVNEERLDGPLPVSECTCTMGALDKWSDYSV